MGSNLVVPIVTDPTSLNPVLNPYSPFALQPNDNPAVSIVLDPLNGPNFISWSHSIMRALSVKNKLPLIDGLISIPSESDRVLYSAWVRANDLVLLWIMNSINFEIKQTMEYFTIAKQVWDELHVRYAQSDDPRVFHLEGSLSNISKGSQMFL
ncbi:hypothetical protein ACS0TY_024597 [Phlomoides rotata]